jgi:hypothetical protein
VFGDDLPMDLKELKKLADALDDSGKQELIYFLQSRTKNLAVPNREIDEIHEQKHKDGACLSKLQQSLGCAIWKIRY